MITKTPGLVDSLSAVTSIQKARSAQLQGNRSHLHSPSFKLYVNEYAPLMERVQLVLQPPCTLAAPCMDSRKLKNNPAQSSTNPNPSSSLATSTRRPRPHSLLMRGCMRPYDDAYMGSSISRCHKMFHLLGTRAARAFIKGGGFPPCCLIYPHYSNHG